MAALAGISPLEECSLSNRGLDRRAQRGSTITAELCARRVRSPALRTASGKSGSAFRVLISADAQEAGGTLRPRATRSSSINTQAASALVDPAPQPADRPAGACRRRGAVSRGMGGNRRALAAPSRNGGLGGRANGEKLQIIQFSTSAAHHDPAVSRMASRASPNGLGRRRKHHRFFRCGGLADRNGGLASGAGSVSVQLVRERDRPSNRPASLPCRGEEEIDLRLAYLLRYSARRRVTNRLRRALWAVSGALT